MSQQHPLFVKVNAMLTQAGLAELPTTTEHGASITAESSDAAARAAVNQHLRRRLLRIEESAGVNLVKARAYLYNDLMEDVWLGQLQLDVIPLLTQYHHPQ